MNESLEELRERYDITEIPLNATMTDVAFYFEANILIVGQIPIDVQCRINDIGAPQMNLAIFRRIDMKIRKIYLTTTSTSTTTLILFSSKDVSVGTAGFGSRAVLVDSSAIEYDARDIVATESYNNSDNINNGASKTTGELTTTGYNKITGWVFSDKDLTVQCLATKATGGTDRIVATVDHTGSATEGTAFEFPVVTAYMTITFDNSSGANTTTCETVVSLSTGA